MLALHLSKSCAKVLANTHTTNHHLCSKGEKNGQRRIMLSFGRTMMKALELLQLAKPGQSNVEK